MLAIQGRALGRKEPLFPEFSLPLPPECERGGAGVRLRDLIAMVVRHEVDAFDARQSERNVLRALTARQIQAGVHLGKITMGESEVPHVAVDVDSAVATAWQAFEDGLFLVFLDGVEQKKLDAQVHPTPDSRLMFARLAMLAGG
jgi:hypothetical protein